MTINSRSGKTHYFPILLSRVTKTQGKQQFLCAQVVSRLILKFKDTAIFAAKLNVSARSVLQIKEHALRCFSIDDKECLMLQISTSSH